MSNDNIFDNIGGALNEACMNYYSMSGTSTGQGASTALLKSLRGMYAVDTPISNASMYGIHDSVRGQVARQAELTLQQRNMLLSQIDSIAGHWIAYAIKSIIASDGFNDLCSKYDIYIKYTDDDDKEKAELLSEDIRNLLRRTGFLDILKDCVMNEGLDYCELFLSTPVKPGYGVEYVSDNMNTREHIGRYKNTNLLGHIRKLCAKLTVKIDLLGALGARAHIDDLCNLAHLLDQLQKEALLLCPAAVAIKQIFFQSINGNFHFHLIISVAELSPNEALHPQEPLPGSAH